MTEPGRAIGDPDGSLSQFCGRIERAINAFQANMEAPWGPRAQHNRPARDEDWMALFLNWAEWHTEVHDMYWRDDIEVGS